MSWLSISLPNPFKSQESDEEDAVNKEEKVAGEEEESSSHVGGVKEDLSELGKTIGRQLWGVASFLAPPPVTDSSSDAAESSDSSSQTFLGIRNDFAEISGSFRSGLSLLSTNKAVNEISKLASNLLQLKEDEEGGDGDESSGEDHGGGDGDGIVGVTDEVLEFAQEMSMRPEFWVDFPLSISNGRMKEVKNVIILCLFGSRRAYVLSVSALSAWKVKFQPAHQGFQTTNMGFRALNQRYDS